MGVWKWGKRRNSSHRKGVNVCLEMKKKRETIALEGEWKMGV